MLAPTRDHPTVGRKYVAGQETNTVFSKPFVRFNQKQFHHPGIISLLGFLERTDDQNPFSEISHESLIRLIRGGTTWPSYSDELDQCDAGEAYRLNYDQTSRTIFIDLITPPNLGKLTSETTFGHS